MGDERSSCCGDETASAGCGCGTSSGRRNWLKTLIFAAVLMAAVIVGVYSLRSQPGKAGPTQGKQVTKPEAAASDGTKTADCSKKCDSSAKSPCCP